MADPVHSKEPVAPGLSGLVAEFATDEEIVRAAASLRERGYSHLDALTPRPVEALQELIAPKRSSLPRSVFVAGLIGATTGLAGQWFCNGFDYPLNVGGRPPFSLPAFIPITFELLVLFAAVTAFFGALSRARLPWLSHPLFDVPGFERASIDRFWLMVGANDPLYDQEATRELLASLGSSSVVLLRSPEEAASAGAEA